MRIRKPGRPCSICSHEQVELINKLLETQTLRGISRRFKGDESMRDSLRRHEQKCLQQRGIEKEQTNAKPETDSLRW